jgi:L-fuconolactonase
MNTMIVDAHQHFWDPETGSHPWMTGTYAPLRRRFGPDDLRPLLVRCGVTKTVLVQTQSSLAETREFLRIASATDFVAGVVGWVELTDGRTEATLREIRSSPEGRHLVGIRHQAHDEPDPNWLVRDDVTEGLRAVGGAGLAYDFLVRPRELAAALAAARRLPEVRFVIDHIAKPPIRGGDDRQWADAMAPFSDLDNVTCKLSGMITEADWRAWRPDDLRPYVRQVLSWFGDDRVMFGSDWPVCTLAGSYAQVLDALIETLSDVTPVGMAKILGGNAVRFYRLPG